MRKIGLHCCNWKLNDITSQLDVIKECGYSFVQVSPIQGAKEDSNEWWINYQPLNMAIVANNIGTKQDLINLCTKANKLGITIVMDVVLRHTAGTVDGALIPHDKVSDLLKAYPEFWKNSENATDYNNRLQVVNCATGMPMLNYDNLNLQYIFRTFLQKLYDCGVRGIRLDQAKHFALPFEGSDFFTNVIKPFNKKMWIYGECIQCEKYLLDGYSDYIDVVSDYLLPTRKNKGMLGVELHDEYLTWGYSKKMNDNILIDEWRNLLQTNRESSMLWFCRPWSDLWRSNTIKNINRDIG